MKIQYLVLIFISTLFTPLTAQEVTQVLRGTVSDADTRFPLIGATLFIQELEKAAITDVDGIFNFDEIPVGRYTIDVAYLGYENSTISSINLSSGKEMILDIVLEEAAVDLKAVVVTAAQDKVGSINQLATVSNRQFTIEEATRYAGTRNEPSRMAQNYAGVSGSSDSRNDIIIRGNSPLGLLWRFEGLEIPNPNHFSLAGNNGGSVSILNSNVLSNSDFLTGAFPAGYGNAVSGVFDINMRKGNNEKTEVLLSAGAIGVEAMIEGNFNEKSKSSYLMNYRYSTTTILTDLLGVDIGFSGEPIFQDAAFKVNLPTEKAGVFSIFGFGGYSTYAVKSEQRDSSNFDVKVGDNNNFSIRSKMGVIGVSHKYVINEQSYLQTVIGLTGSREQSIVDSVNVNTESAPVVLQNNVSTISGFQAHINYTRKINRKWLSKFGVIYHQKYFSINDQVFVEDLNTLVPNRQGDGGAGLTQAYTAWQYKFEKGILLNFGLHAQHFDLNNKNTLEWRVGAKIPLNESGKTTLNFGTGLHSQTQLLPLYFAQNSESQLSNKELDFTKSIHFVAGVDHQVNRDVRFKGEVYYQALSSIPIHSTNQPSSFSMINEGGDYLINYESDLVSEGISRNYGVELTLEKFYSKGYYFLITNSLFKTEYEGSNQIRYPSKFDGRFISNVLAGKEFKVGKHNKFLIDIKTTYAGGRRYTPINLEASRANGATVLYEEATFAKRHKNYFRTDIKLTYRINRPNVSHEFFFNLDNVFDIDNIFAQYFNPLTENIVTINQLGLFPFAQYKLEF